MAGKKRPGKDVEVEIPAPKFAMLEVVIDGDTPLIAQQMSQKKRNEMEAKQRKGGRSPRKLTPRKPEEEFEGARYRFKKGRKQADGFPVTGVKTAMASAGYRYLGVKDKVSTLGAIYIFGEGPSGNLVEIDFTGKEPEMRRDVVRLPTGVADLRYRPGYNKWSMKLMIRYIATFIQPQAILHLLNTAGHAVGIGEWRPEHKGQFGMFHVRAGKAPRKRKAAKKAS